MLHDMTPESEEQLSKGMATAYIGFDPTAPSLTIGNYVQIMLLTLFQKAGHRPIYLAGGATGRIGDPSGKDKERTLKSIEELDTNLEFQKSQAEKFLDFSDKENSALVVNNYDFYKDLNVLTFLRDAGKNLTINYMLSKDSVKNRLESGLSFTEFSYQLLQAYDFLQLYKHYDCKFQMGGSDQWGNITSGTEFIRRNIEGGKAFAITTPLLTKSDGKKFGKSEDGNIWLDPNLTSPYRFYQFWLRASDEDIVKFYKYFSLESREIMEGRIASFSENPNTLKKALAKELTIRIHSEKDFISVEKVSDLLFNKNASGETLRSLPESSFLDISKEIPFYSISKNEFTNGINIVELLASKTSITTSKGDARRAIKSNSISINKNKIQNHESIINHDNLLHGKYMMVENGKKNKILVEAV